MSKIPLWWSHLPRPPPTVIWTASRAVIKGSIQYCWAGMRSRLSASELLSSLSSESWKASTRQTEKGLLAVLKYFRPRPNVNVKPFIRRTKLIELSSWKVRRMAQLNSCEWVWIVQYVLSIRLLQTYRTFEDRLRGKRRSSLATN